MSSDHSIHLWDKKIEGQVSSLDGLMCATAAIVLRDEADNPGNTERFTLFVRDSRLAEAVLLFHKIAQDLADLAVAHTAEVELDQGSPEAHGVDPEYEAAADAQRPAHPDEEQEAKVE